MLRTLRAFAWMRWRVFLNSLERTEARDRLERLSIATEQLGPLIAMLLLVPSMVGISAMSAFAGVAIAHGTGRAVTFGVIRFVAVATTILAVVGPIVIPVVERANPVRLLLLPIPRATLYVAQASGALTDPWTLLLIPIVIFLPLGMVAGGAIAAALLALLGGLLLLLIVIGLSTLTSSLVQLVLRDRRRGELIGLLFILIIPMTGMLMSGFDSQMSDRHRKSEPRAPSAPGIADRLYAMLPSERYASVIRSSAVDGPLASTALTSTAALALTTAGIHGLGLLAFGQLLASPGSVARRRGGQVSAARATRLPGLSGAASAVAMAQVRLALRTPRGRATFLSPMVLLGVLAFLSIRSGGAHLTFIPQGGVGLAAFAAFIGLLGILPLAMNQFAIDGAGLTLEMLAPISDGDLLAGKAVANAAIGGVPALLCIAAAAALFPGGDIALWLSLLLGVLAVYLLTAPVAALVSILFPRVVDLNSIGRGSNAHGIAGLIGLATFAVSAAPPALLVLFATIWLKQPAIAPVLVLAWCGIAYVICRVLFLPLRGLLARRRENLGLVV
jgi:hypothetical protein